MALVQTQNSTKHCHKTHLKLNKTVQVEIALLDFRIKTALKTKFAGYIQV